MIARKIWQEGAVFIVREILNRKQVISPFLKMCYDRNNGTEITEQKLKQRGTADEIVRIGK